jgi:hypothetical protein
MYTFPLGTFTLSPPVRTISPANTMMTPSEVNKPIRTNDLESDNHTFGTPEVNPSILPTTRPRGRQAAINKALRKTKSEPNQSRIRKTASPQRRSVGTKRVSGINRVTGEETLVGKYKPIMHANLFVCPDRRCWTDGIAPCWTTKNGYKYHLQEACHQNPTSTLCLKIAKGEAVRRPKSTTKSIVAICACGQTFLSHQGFHLHQHESESTKDGKCLLKPRRSVLCAAGKFSGIRVELLNLNGDVKVDSEKLPDCATSSLNVSDTNSESAFNVDDWLSFERHS